jgi:hypothetical protein
MQDSAALRLFDNEGDMPRAGKRFLIPGPAGAIEALLGDAQDYAVDAPIVVVCHPHPLYGGTLDNKVAYTLAKAVNELGGISLRFNFRGVGHSEGSFDRGLGETEDLLAVCDWFQQRYPGAPLWLAGFSFGAMVALQGQARLRPERLILVAPAVTREEFPRDIAITTPCTVVQGGQDEVIEPQQVADWVERQSHPVDFRWLDEAGHFFHGHLIELKAVIHRACGTAL